MRLMITFPFLFIGLLGLVSCSNSPRHSSMDDLPITSATMRTGAGSPVSELSPRQVAKQIKREAYHVYRFALDTMRDLTFFDEVFSPDGVLKRRVTLGPVMRAYSLMDNSASVVAKIFSTWPNVDQHDELGRELLKNSIQRGLSDRYIATVHVSGIGLVGYVSVPVYSVYQDWQEINWIAFRSLQPVTKPVLSATSKSSRVEIGSLDNRKAREIFPDTNVNSHLYWFDTPDGKNTLLVRVVQRGERTYLFSEEDGSWWVVETGALAPLTSDVPQYRINSQSVAIRAVEVVQ